MNRFNHSDRDDFSRRPRKEKKQRGGGKNYTHTFSNQFKEFDMENDDLPKEIENVNE